ncbi:MAG TPA: complex I NDUFA9 subunit family protein [Symbiobacteriaceae bacterium]|nr:complex I NDUFA9 subunit family protein [Symbiobacteriaceae bacterium]
MSVILVAGGTGFLGSHIVQRLLQGGHRVMVLSRNPADLPPGVEGRPGDVRDQERLNKALQGIQTLVIAVQFPNAPVENPKKGLTYVKIDGEGTERLVKAAQQAGVKRLVYLSGAGAGEGRTEPWFIAKEMAERAVRTSGIPFTIIRPSWVYGPEDKSLNKFVTFARLLPFVPVVGNGRTKVQPVHVDDVAEAVARALEVPAAVNQTYGIGGPAALTMDQIIREMLQTMGKRRPLLHNPTWLMKLVTAPLTLLPTPPLSPAAVDFVVQEAPVDNGPLLRDLGLQLTPLAEGLGYLRS